MIDFRIWDKKHNQLLPNYILYNIKADDLIFSTLNKDWEIRLNTGLIDKDNNVLFEWDKIEFYNHLWLKDISTVVWYKTGGWGVEWCEIFLHELFEFYEDKNKWKYLNVLKI